MAECPPELRRLYRDHRVIPFVGAGASMAVRWSEGQRGPSWREVVDEAARQLGCDNPDLLRIRGADLQILEYFFIQKGSFAPLTNWLASNFSSAKDDDILACPIHAALAELSRCRIFYTTNYDDFLERALSAKGRNTSVVTTEQNINHDSSLCEVVKFHGDFNTPAQMVLSESHYMDRMRLESPMDFKLRSDMLGRALLFIGYSFSDQNVGYIFHVVNRLFSALPGSYSGRRAYIILHEPSDFERKLFHARNIEVIPSSSGDITSGIAAVLEQMSA